MIPELSFGIQRFAYGRRKERFRSYLQNLRRLTGCSCLDATKETGKFQVRYRAVAELCVGSL